MLTSDSIEEKLKSYDEELKNIYKLYFLAGALFIYELKREKTRNRVSLEQHIKTKIIYGETLKILPVLVQKDFKVSSYINEDLKDHIVQIMENEEKHRLKNVVLARLKDATDLREELKPHIQQKDEINFIDLFFSKDQTAILTEILISKNVKKEQKQQVFLKIVKEYPHLINKVFTSSPLKEEMKESLQEAIPTEIANQCIKDIINKKNLTQEEREYTLKVANIFIENELVDVSKITFSWSNDEEMDKVPITAAAQAAINNNLPLCEYLYSLPHTEATNLEIQENSDKVMIYNFINRHPKNVRILLRQPNFNCTIDKFEFFVSEYIKKAGTTEILEEMTCQKLCVNFMERLKTPIDQEKAAEILVHYQSTPIDHSPKTLTTLTKKPADNTEI